MAKPRTARHPSPSQANSQSDLAHKTDLPLQRIKRLVRDGLRRRPDGTFHVDDARQMAAERALRNPGHYAGDPKTTLSWKQRKLRAEAQNVELSLQERRGKLVAREDVRRAWGLQATRIKNAFLGMGRALAPVLAHKGPVECQVLIDGRVLEILRHLTHAQYSGEHQPGSKKHEKQAVAIETDHGNHGHGSSSRRRAGVSR